MRNSFDQQVAAFLRKQRGEATYAHFAKKLGISASTLHRLENSQQSVTVRSLEHILGRLKCRLSEVFPGQF